MKIFIKLTLCALITIILSVFQIDNVLIYLFLVISTLFTMFGSLDFSDDKNKKGDDENV